METPPHIKKLIEDTKWECHACKTQRPDKFIKVLKHDISKEFNEPAGNIIFHFRYCSDNGSCFEKAINRSSIEDILLRVRKKEI